MPEYSFINITGASYEDVKKALGQWTDTYASGIDGDLFIGIHRSGPQSSVIKIGGQLPSDYFYYLVNYLRYPEGIKHNVTVAGYTVPRSPARIGGRKVMVYVPENDRDYDMVYAVTTDGTTYKIDFGGKVKVVPSAKSYIPADKWDSLTDWEPIKTDKGTSIKHERNISTEGNPRNRLILLAVIVVLAVFAGWLLSPADPRLSSNILLFVAPAVTIWFFFDYKMLRNNNLYFFSLLLSAAILLYQFHLIRRFSLSPRLNLATMPLSFLLAQKPARLIFKSSRGREPVVNINMASGDVFYGLMLFIFTAVIMTILYEII